MITHGQAKRLMREYGVTERSSAVVQVMSHVATTRDPQGVYADARAIGDWIAAYYATPLDNVSEDATVVPWGYRSDTLDTPEGT